MLYETPPHREQRPPVWFAPQCARTPEQEKSTRSKLNEEADPSSFSRIKFQAQLQIDASFLIMDFDQTHVQETHKRRAELETSHTIRCLELLLNCGHHILSSGCCARVPQASA